MNFPQHMKAGLIASAAITVSARFTQGIDKLENLLLIFGLCLAGSLAPDLDTKSTPHRITAILGLLLCSGSIYVKQPYPALYFSSGFLFVSASRHRGWTHSYFLPLIFIGIAVYTSASNILTGYYILAFGIGLITHYALDKMSPFKLNNWIKL